MFKGWRKTVGRPVGLLLQPAEESLQTTGAKANATDGFSLPGFTSVYPARTSVYQPASVARRGYSTDPAGCDTRLMAERIM